jgi:hypothetical protein
VKTMGWLIAVVMPTSFIPPPVLVSALPETGTALSIQLALDREEAVVPWRVGESLGPKSVQYRPYLGFQVRRASSTAKPLRKRALGLLGQKQQTLLMGETGEVNPACDEAP